MIEPNETHILKAVAWDTLYASAMMESSIENAAGAGELKKTIYNSILATMDAVLQMAGEKLQDPKTWEEKGDGDD